MQPPMKRQRMSPGPSQPTYFNPHPGHRKLRVRLKTKFEAIFAKYDKDFTGIGDEVDLETGRIVVDNGHLLKMRDEHDESGLADEGEGDDFHNGTGEYGQDEDMIDELSGEHQNAEELTARESSKRRRRPTVLDGLGMNTLATYPEDDTVEHVLSQIGNGGGGAEEDPYMAVDPLWDAPDIPGLLDPSLPGIHLDEGNVDFLSQRSESPYRSIWDPEQPDQVELHSETLVPWTTEEETLLYRLKTTTNLSYKDIHSHFPERSEQTLRTRWHIVSHRPKEDNGGLKNEPDTEEKLLQQFHGSTILSLDVLAAHFPDRPIETLRRLSTLISSRSEEDFETNEDDFENDEDDVEEHNLDSETASYVEDCDSDEDRALLNLERGTGSTKLTRRQLGRLEPSDDGTLLHDLRQHERNAGDINDFGLSEAHGRASMNDDINGVALKNEPLRLSWTAEEDALVKHLRSTTNLRWGEMTDFFRGRSKEAIQVRWYKVTYGPGKRKSDKQVDKKFNPDDEVLCPESAKLNKYENMCSPNGKNGSKTNKKQRLWWTAEEDALLLHLRKTTCLTYEQLRPHFRGRASDAIKNRWCKVYQKERLENDAGVAREENSSDTAQRTGLNGQKANLTRQNDEFGLISMESKQSPFLEIESRKQKKRLPWTAEDDKLLQQLATRDDFTLVDAAAHFPEHSTRILAKRWRDFLKWTERENEDKRTEEPTDNNLDEHDVGANLTETAPSAVQCAISTPTRKPAHPWTAKADRLLWNLRTTSNFTDEDIITFFPEHTLSTISSRWIALLILAEVDALERHAGIHTVSKLPPVSLEEVDLLKNGTSALTKVSTPLRPPVDHPDIPEWELPGWDCELYRQRANNLERFRNAQTDAQRVPNGRSYASETSPSLYTGVVPSIEVEERGEVSGLVLPLASLEKTSHDRLYHDLTANTDHNSAEPFETDTSEHEPTRHEEFTMEWIEDSDRHSWTEGQTARLKEKMIKYQLFATSGNPLHNEKGLAKLIDIERELQPSNKSGRDARKYSVLFQAKLRKEMKSIRSDMAKRGEIVKCVGGWKLAESGASGKDASHMEGPSTGRELPEVVAVASNPRNREFNGTENLFQGGKDQALHSRAPSYSIPDSSEVAMKQAGLFIDEAENQDKDEPGKFQEKNVGDRSGKGTTVKLSSNERLESPHTEKLVQIHDADMNDHQDNKIDDLVPERLNEEERLVESYDMNNNTNPDKAVAPLTSLSRTKSSEQVIDAAPGKRSNLSSKKSHRSRNPRSLLAKSLVIVGMEPSPPHSARQIIARTPATADKYGEALVPQRSYATKSSSKLATPQSNKRRLPEVGIISPQESGRSLSSMLGESSEDELVQALSNTSRPQSKKRLLARKRSSLALPATPLKTCTPTKIITPRCGTGGHICSRSFCLRCSGD